MGGAKLHHHVRHAVVCSFSSTDVVQNCTTMFGTLSYVLSDTPPSGELVLITTLPAQHVLKNHAHIAVHRAAQSVGHNYVEGSAQPASLDPHQASRTCPT